MLRGRLNKGPAYALGLAIASVAIIGAFLLPPGPTPWIYLVAFVAGVGFSAQYVFPWSILPDVIEVDQAATGERHEGIYFGVNSFLGKGRPGRWALLLSGWALKLYGYVPDAVQTPTALFGIRFFFAVVPVIAFVVALPLLDPVPHPTCGKTLFLEISFPSLPHLPTQTNRQAGISLARPADPLRVSLCRGIMLILGWAHV